MDLSPLNTDKHTQDQSVFHQKIDYLNSLIQASKAINSCLDLDEVLRLILQSAIHNTRAEAGTIYLIDSQQNILWSRVCFPQKEIDIRLKIGEGIAGHVAETGESIILSDAYADPRFQSSFDFSSGFQTQNMLCTPLKNDQDKIIGVFQLLNKKNGGFASEDVMFLSGLSSHAAIAVEKARLHQELLEKRALQKELQIAGDIQNSFLPQTIPVLPDYDITCLQHPCEAIGGDYCDIIATNQDLIYFVIADVAGKGIPAALLMASLRMALHAFLQCNPSANPDRLLRELNNLMTRSIPNNKFITIFIARLVPTTGELEYINAGHAFPIHISSQNASTFGNRRFPAMGLKTTTEYGNGNIRMERGDVLVFFTDGITEAMNAEYEEYEEDRLVAVCQRSQNLSVSEIQGNILKDMERFRAGAPQNDDVTLLLIKRND